MRSFRVNTFGAAVLLSTLLMGVLGAFVVIPVAGIQWTWNLMAPHLFSLPTINAWQAVLLYLAGGCLLYLSGLIHIEIKTADPVSSKGPEAVAAVKTTESKPVEPVAAKSETIEP